MLLEGVSRAAVLKASTALLGMRKQNNLDGDQKISLKVAYHFTAKSKKCIRITMPHSRVTELTDVCVFVKDLKKESRDYSDTIDHFERLLAKEKEKRIQHIIPIQQLKQEYQPYEAKRRLCNLYDFYLGDARIMHFLPGHLGKCFYSRRRFPIPIDFGAENFQQAVSKALCTEFFAIIPHGDNSQVWVGSTALSAQQLTDNILTALNKLETALPGGYRNIKSVHLNLEQQLSLKLFSSDRPKDDINMPGEETTGEIPEAEEISTVMGAKVRAWPDGRVTIVKVNKDKKPSKGNAKKTRVRKRALKTVKNDGPNSDNAKKSPTKTTQGRRKLKRKNRAATDVDNKNSSKAKKSGAGASETSGGAEVTQNAGGKNLKRKQPSVDCEKNSTGSAAKKRKRVRPTKSAA